MSFLSIRRWRYLRSCSLETWEEAVEPRSLLVFHDTQRRPLQCGHMYPFLDECWSTSGGWRASRRQRDVEGLRATWDITESIFTIRCRVTLTCPRLQRPAKRGRQTNTSWGGEERTCSTQPHSSLVRLICDKVVWLLPAKSQYPLTRAVLYGIWWFHCDEAVDSGFDACRGRWLLVVATGGDHTGKKASTRHAATKGRGSKGGHHTLDVRFLAAALALPMTCCKMSMDIRWHRTCARKSMVGTT